MRSGVSGAQRIKRKNFKGFMLSSCWGRGRRWGEQSEGSGLEGGEGQKKEGKKKIDWFILVVDVHLIHLEALVTQKSQSFDFRATHLGKVQPLTLTFSIRSANVLR